MVQNINLNPLKSSLVKKPCIYRGLKSSTINVMENPVLTAKKSFRKALVSIEKQEMVSVDTRNAQQVHWDYCSHNSLKKDIVSYGSNTEKIISM